MAQQPSECPNCRRVFIGAPGAGSAPGCCRVCGTPLIAAGGEKQAEVQDHLYGPHASLTSVRRISVMERSEAR